jgi:hypothetical protein
LPLESVTTVDLPSDALLVEKLPEPPEWVIVPPGPVVVPLTLPSPAVIDVDIEVELDGADSPFFSSTTLQLSDEDVLPDAPVPVLELELLELVCATAAVTPTANTARNATSAFTRDLPELGLKKKGGCAASRPRSRRSGPSRD